MREKFFENFSQKVVFFAFLVVTYMRRKKSKFFSKRVWEIPKN